MGRKRVYFKHGSCLTSGCNKEAKVRGHCQACYANFRYHILHPDKGHLKEWANKLALKNARLEIMDEGLSFSSRGRKQNANTKKASRRNQNVNKGLTTKARKAG